MTSPRYSSGVVTAISSIGSSSTGRAVVPQAELHLYATNLSSMTHGRGTFTRRFHGYEQMPHEAAQRVVEEAAKDRQELAEV